MSDVKICLPSLGLYPKAEDWVRFLSPLETHWLSEQIVRIDFSACGFLSAEGAAILAAFVLHRRLVGGETHVESGTGSYDLHRQLGRWQLSELFGQPRFPWTDNAIPLLHQERLDGLAVEGYISTAIRAGDNMPAMTPELVRETNRSLCELFANVFEHSYSQIGGLAIGQYYPVKKQIQFCVCDAGMGLVAKVQEAGYARYSSGAAIRWALAEGHSTKSGPGGLGLFMLQEFVKANGGYLRILANDGYYEQRGSADRAYSLQKSFPGTLIQIGLLIRPDEVYTISDEEDVYTP